MKKSKIVKKAEKVVNNAKDKIDNKIKKHGAKNFIMSVIMIIMISIASITLIFALYIIISAPNFDKELLYSKEASILYDKNGNEIIRFGSQNRELITYDDLPQVFVDALVATEDSRFFQHNGLDIARFIKASFKQVTGSNEGGASTLSMQLVKKTYTSSEAHGIKGIIRKFTDIYMAVFKLENSYTKEEIIEFYANSLWFGHDGSLNYEGISGVETASQFFFNKHVNELTLAEASLLVGMYQNPNLYNPYRNPEGCRNRQKIVLQLMVNHGYITEDEKNDALAIPVESLLGDRSAMGTNNENQAVLDYIVNEVEEKTGKDPHEVPMKIYSTIDLNVQNTLNRMNKGELFTFYNEKDQVGAAVTDVESGALVALSGGRNYQALGINRATVRRQPGSTAKPFFDYGPYLEYISGSSTGDYFFDDPYTYSNGTPITDADDQYQGMITMRQALVGSRNIPALQAFQKVMAQDSSLIPNYVHSFGLDYGDNLYESASIGGFEGVSPIEMSAAFGVYARGGYYVKPYSFTKVIYDDGSVFEYKPDKEKVVSEQTSYMITSMLIDAANSPYGLSGVGVAGTQIATKTGTTTIDDSAIQALGLPLGTIMDSWSASYSPEYSIALWYGYDTVSPEFHMNTTTGWNARTRLMGELVKNIYSANRTFKVPSGVVTKEVEKNTVPLQLPSPYTPADMKMSELFKEGTEPTEVSNRFMQLDAPSNLKGVIKGSEVSLTWSGISTPNAINTTYLQKYYTDNYGTFASKYYENRVNENNSLFGKLGYEVFKKKSNGKLTSLGWVSGTSFNQTIDTAEDNTFVVKAAYKYYKANSSKGVETTIKASSTKDTKIDNTTNNTTNNNTTNTTTNTTNTTKDSTPTKTTNDDLD